jgi:nucleoside-diphosphate-sugar epimerase
LEPINEQFNPNPINIYGESKLAAENYVADNLDKIPTTILRPSTVYGPRDKDVLQFFKTIRHGIIPKLGGREKYLSLIFVKDLVKGIIEAAESKKTVGQTYFLAMDKPVSWDEFSETTLKIMGKKGIRINVPTTILKGVTNITHWIAKIIKTNPALNKERFYQMQPDFWICSPQKANEDFGFRAETTIENGIRETINWYVNHRWL